MLFGETARKVCICRWGVASQGGGSGAQVLGCSGASCLRHGEQLSWERAGGQQGRMGWVLGAERPGEGPQLSFWRHQKVVAVLWKEESSSPEDFRAGISCEDTQTHQFSEQISAGFSPIVVQLPSSQTWCRQLFSCWLPQGRPFG